MAAPQDKGVYMILNAQTRDAIDSWNFDGQHMIDQNIASQPPAFMDPNQNQLWRCDKVDGQFYRIVNPVSNMVWELVNSASPDGKNILTKVASTDNKLQHWKFVKTQGSTNVPASYQIINRYLETICADLKYGGPSKTQILGWSMGDRNPHQTWIFIPVELGLGPV